MEINKRHLHINKLIYEGYNDLIISNTLRSFGLSLTSLFIPLFLLKIGITFKEIIFYEIILLLISINLLIIINHFINKIGIKKILLFSHILNIIFYITLINAKKIIYNTGKLQFIIISASCFAIFTSTYWMTYQLYFIKVRNNKSKTKKLSLMIIIPVLLSISSPLIGSIIIEKINFEITFFFTILLIILSMIFTISLKDIKVNTKFKIKKIIRLNEAKINLLFFVEGIIFVGTGFLWPILLFLFSVQIITMGLLYMISDIVYAILTHQKSINKNRTRLRYVPQSLIGQIIGVIMKVLAKGIYILLGIQSMGGFFMPLWTIPTHSLFYKRSKKNLPENILSRELYQHSGRLITLFILFALVYLLGPIKAIITTLIISGLSAILLNFYIPSLEKIE